MEILTRTYLNWNCINKSNGEIVKIMGRGQIGAVSGLPSFTIMNLIEAVIQKTSKMGFKCYVIINVHGSNDTILFLCVRRIFESIVIYKNPE